ncbi:hypothetical protein Q8G38_00385 [Halomonas venusta]|uniref:hypothetical protein n=1 Tax=Vreelandella venusta TaxID=44935 RepID=UPI00295EE154|nr:hypothetical protein [Halomonas venusta]MDW0357766.1 hypothetical protein [Halomonas venusta]
MDNHSFSQNETSNPRLVIDRMEVAALLQAELGLPESAIGDFERVIKAASDREGRTGHFAPPGAGMRAAHDTGAEHLNRILVSYGWRCLQRKHLRFCMHPEKQVIILYQNVEEACNRAKSPINISSRGIETEELLTTPRNMTYPIFQPTVWFLCTSFKCGTLKAELSKPLPFQGMFSGFSLRLNVYNQDGPELTTPDTPVDNSFEEELGDLELSLR